MIIDNELIIFDKITKSFNKDKVLDSISFVIKNNSITTLVGPNGAGKSTIAKLILGIETPDSGQLTIANRLSFAYLPQKIYINSYLPLRVSDFLKSYSVKETYSDFDSEILEFGQIDKLYNKQFVNFYVHINDMTYKYYI